MNVFDPWFNEPVDVRHWYVLAQEIALSIAIRRDFAAHFALGHPLGWRAEWHILRHQDLQQQRARLEARR